MEKETFLEKVIPMVKGFLPVEYALLDVQVIETSQYTGLNLVDNLHPYTPMPVLNLDQELISMKKNRMIDPVVMADSISMSLSRMMKDREKDMSAMKNILPEWRNYEGIKNQLFIAPMSKESVSGNKAITVKGDIRFYVKLDIGLLNDKRATADVTNNMLNQWGVSKEQLFQDASVNMLEIKPSVLSSLADILSDEIYDLNLQETKKIAEQYGGLYRLSTSDERYGAGLIYNNDVLDQVAKEMKSRNYYILPSSVNDVVIIPVTEYLCEDIGTVDMLTGMINTVNEFGVRPEERLSDTLYHYDYKNHSFEAAKEYINHLEFSQDKDKEQEEKLQNNDYSENPKL